ncbi:MAG: transglutaminase family protein [archaeon]
MEEAKENQEKQVKPKPFWQKELSTQDFVVLTISAVLLTFTFFSLAFHFDFFETQESNSNLYLCTSGDRVSNPELCPGGATEVQNPINNPSNFVPEQTNPQTIVEAESCGDNTCQTGENCMSCSQDCYCADNFVCQPTRSSSDLKGCYQVSCGDGYCDSEYENQVNCCNDCECPSGKSCQNNVCLELNPVINSNLKLDKVHSVTYLKATNDGGEIEISNTGNDTANNISITFTSPENYFDSKTITFHQLAPGETTTGTVILKYKDTILNVLSDYTSMAVEANIKFYNSLNEEKISNNSFSMSIKGRNFMTGTYPDMYPSWVTPTQPVVREFATKSTGGIATYRSTDEQMLAARWLFDSFIAYGIKYTTDAHASQDYIQFPYETLRNKGGDCEDLSLLYASLLEAVGINSILIKTPGHVYSGFENKEGEIVAIETTASNFEAALITGEQKYRDSGDTLIFPSDYWEEYPAIILPEDTEISLPNVTKQTGNCGITFNFSQGWIATSEVQFTNSGNATGAGCAAMYFNDEYNNRIGEDLSCWTVNPGEQLNFDYIVDIDFGDLLDSYSCYTK